MTSRNKWLMAATVCALAAGTVLAGAQPPGGGRGQGRGLGGGGMFGGGGPMQLVQSKDVLEDIKATDDQKTKLADWAKEEGPKMFEKMNEKLADVPMEERFQKMAGVMADLNKEYWKDVEKVLKPEQYTRIRQIGVQAMGIRAFSDKDVVEKLKLDDGQKEKVKTITDDLQKESMELGQGLFQQGQPPDQEKMQEFQKKSAELRKKAFDKAKEVLKDDQKKAWADLTGKEFDVTKLNQFGGRRGGGQ
jgi:hypothetical protein